MNENEERFSFICAAPIEGGTNLNGKNPLFVDPLQRNFRLKPGSPAIAAGKGGVIPACRWQAWPS